MIVVRSPFRVSFVGGGSDLPAYFRRFGGAVVSTTINKFMYLVIHPYFNAKIRVKYSRIEDVERIEDIKHPIVRECLTRQQIPRGMEIASFADVPAGSGLGSSSSFTVGLLHALEAYCGRQTSPASLASAACDVEINRLGEPIGKQDQYAAAFGGMNFIRFHPNDTVDVEPIAVPDEVLLEFEQHLMMFYLGQERPASSILSSQSSNMDNPALSARVTTMVAIASAFRRALERGNLSECGYLLGQNWDLKRELATEISSPWIDEIYARAIAAGALGGKLLGAGTGGFLLIYCKPQSQGYVREALQELREMEFHFSNVGSQVIFSDIDEPMNTLQPLYR